MGSGASWGRINEFTQEARCRYVGKKGGRLGGWEGKE